MQSGAADEMEANIHFPIINKQDYAWYMQEHTFFPTAFA